MRNKNIQLTTIKLFLPTSEAMLSNLIWSGVGSLNF